MGGWGWGGASCCILGGDVFSWGSNSHGQLGLGKDVSRQLTPVLVCALNGVAVTQISAGGTHTLFLTLPGLVYCCGANKCGQLGLNRVDEKGTRKSVFFLSFIFIFSFNKYILQVISTCLFKYRIIHFCLIANRQIQHLSGTCPQTSERLRYKLWRVAHCCVNNGTNTDASPLSLIYTVWKL